MYLDVSWCIFWYVLAKMFGFSCQKRHGHTRTSHYVSATIMRIRNGKGWGRRSCLNVMVFSFSGLKWEQFGGGGGLILWHVWPQLFSTWVSLESEATWPLSGCTQTFGANWMKADCRERHPQPHAPSLHHLYLTLLFVATLHTEAVSVAKVDHEMLALQDIPASTRYIPMIPRHIVGSTTTFVYMYIYIYTHKKHSHSICIYTYICICIQETFTYIKYTYNCIYTDLHTHTHIYIYTYIIHMYLALEMLNIWPSK